VAGFVVWWLVWETFGTAMGTGYLGLLPEMFTSFEARSRVAVRMNGVQVVGLLIGLAAPPALAQAIGWGPAVTLFALIALVTIYQGVPAMQENVPSTPAPSLLSSLQHTFGNRSFLTVVLAQTMRFVTTGALTMGMGLYVKYSLGGDDSITSILLAMAFIVAGLTLWPWRRFVADRWGARATLLAAYAVVGVGAGLLYLTPPGPWVYVVTALVGVGLSGMILMGDVIVADVIDEDEARTGERRAGA
jgi:GPH family glycoside/pentoside/hexuronide:cation symporter